MPRKLSKSELTEFAINQAGADMIGFANIERFDNCPAEFHPHRLNEFTKTVIVVGLRIIRGAMRSLEQGTGRICYNAYGYGGINANWMPDVLRKLAVYIEDRGYEAVPSIQWTGMPPLEPIIDHRLAAVAAGLGEIGYSKVFLTERFGPLQRLGVLLTDAEIPADPMKVSGICDRCMMCVKDCPAAAIDAHETVQIDIDGHKIEWGKLDVFGCGLAHAGAHPETTPFTPDSGFDISEEMKIAEEKLRSATTDVERRGVAEEIAVRVKKKYHHPIHVIVHALGGSRAMCGALGCMRSCLAHLDQKGSIGCEFNHVFREKGKKPQAMHKYRSKTSNAVVQREDDQQSI